jgi:hypothetical protein
LLQIIRRDLECSDSDALDALVQLPSLANMGEEFQHHQRPWQSMHGKA